MTDGRKRLELVLRRQKHRHRMVLGKTAPQGSGEISEATLGLSPSYSNNMPIVSSFSRSKNDVDDYIVSCQACRIC